MIAELLELGWQYAPGVFTPIAYVYGPGVFKLVKGNRVFVGQSARKHFFIITIGTSFIIDWLPSIDAAEVDTFFMDFKLGV